jgi:nucleoid DNA-binding protein
MVITREELIKILAERSGYYQRDIRMLLRCLDDVVFEKLCNATLDEDVQIQMVTGIKLGCKKVGERPRVDPRTQEPIMVDESPKPFAKFSQDFRFKLEDAYNSKKDG